MADRDGKLQLVGEFLQLDLPQTDAIAVAAAAIGRDHQARGIRMTPRKCLGFKTPFQAILKELGKDVQIRFS